MGCNNKRTILLVEDDAITSMTEKLALEKFGYNVITVNSGLDAIDAFNENNNIDLVLMDIELGEGLSGPESAKILLQERDIPIIFLSNHTEPEIVETTEIITSYGYVVKNSGITVLDASIKIAFKLFEANSLPADREIKDKAILDNVPGLIYRCSNNPEWTMEYISEGAFSLTGYHPDELINNCKKSYRNLIHQDDRHYVWKEIREAVSMKKHWEVEYRLLTWDNVEKWVFERGKVVEVDPEGREILEGFVTDIFGRKKTEDTINKSEEHYRTLFENTDSGILVIDEDSTISLANESFAESFGYSRDEIQNKKKLTEIICREDLAFILKEHYLRRSDPGKAKSSYEFTFRNKYNELRYYLVFVSMIGGSKKSLATIIDITERKEAEAALKIAKEKYWNLFMNSQIGIFRTDINTGIVLEANDCFARLLGFKDRDELLSEAVCIEDFYLDKAVREKMIFFLREHGENRNYEAQFKRKNGSLFWIRFSVRLIAGEGWIEGVNEDITDLKMAEAEKSVIYNELLTSEKKYRLIFENSPLGLLHFNKKGIITDCNFAFEKITGSTWSDIVGTDMFSLQHRGIVSAFINAMDGLSGKYEGVYRFTESTNHNLYRIEFKAIYDENESIIGGVGIVENITNKRAVELAMLDELENERSRIAHLLHDSLGQKLGAVLYLAQAFCRKYDKTGKLSYEDMEKLITLSSSALEETRFISRGLDLSIIDIGSFLDSLKEIVVRTRSVYGIEVDLEVKDKLKLYDKIKLINLYYIIIESINNAIQHGKAYKIVLRYYAEGTKDFFTILSYQKIILKYENPGMGLRIMKYRADIAGMKFNISSEGKRVSVSVALGDNQDINSNNDKPDI